MNPIQTGIAVALALTVVLLFFIFPSISPLQPSQATELGAETNTRTMSSPSTTELQITDEKVGSGPPAEAGDTLTVNYVGKLTDGTVFDASARHGQSFSFKIGANSVIAGWDQGLLGARAGGKRVLVVPPSYGYGASPGHPLQDKVLIFEVEIVKIQK